MNCDKVRKLITSRFAGGISASDEIALEQHLNSCSCCREFHDQEGQMTESLRSLDYGKYRPASIDAFGRLAVTVRTYRTPRTSWIDTLNLRPNRLVWVTAMLVVIMAGLSNLNFTYSYTSGASLNISFDPPLQKSESIETSEFYTRINDSLNKILSSPESSRKVSWAIQMDGESLKGIDINIATDEAIDLVEIYDSLLEYYPALARGEVSISPLKVAQKDTPIRMLVNRKSDSLSDNDIRNVVENDLPDVMAKVELQIKSLEKDSETLRVAVEDQLPEIMNIINDTIEKNQIQLNSMDLTTIQNPDTGNMSEEFKKLLSPAKEIESSIHALLEDKGLKLEDYDNLLHFEIDGGTSRIMIGDGCTLFEPKACGGKKISIIRGSGDDINLNGASDLIQSSEIDDLLEGRINEDDLQKIINDRIKVNKDENYTVIIDIFKGEKKAEIKIDSNDAIVKLTSPVIPNIKLTTPDNIDTTDKEDLKDLEAWKKNLDSEREIVLKQYDSQLDAYKNPNMKFQTNGTLYPEIIDETEINDLIKGTITSKELEKKIENRLSDEDKKSDSSFSLMRDDKLITITISGGKVTIDLADAKSSDLGNGSIIVKQSKKASSSSSAKASASASTGMKIDVFADGFITDSELDDLISGELLPSVLESLVKTRLNDKYGNKWQKEFETSVVKSKDGNTVNIDIKDGVIRIKVANKGNNGKPSSEQSSMSVVAKLSMA
jgi:hypothetical protein